jgi:hypothetical protein
VLGCCNAQVEPETAEAGTQSIPFRGINPAADLVYAGKRVELLQLALQFPVN